MGNMLDKSMAAAAPIPLDSPKRDVLDVIRKDSKTRKTSEYNGLSRKPRSLFS